MPLRHPDKDSGGRRAALAIPFHLHPRQEGAESTEPLPPTGPGRGEPDCRRRRSADASREQGASETRNFGLWRRRSRSWEAGPRRPASASETASRGRWTGEGEAEAASAEHVTLRPGSAACGTPTQSPSGPGPDPLPLARGGRGRRGGREGVGLARKGRGQLGEVGTAAQGRPEPPGRRGR